MRRASAPLALLLALAAPAKLELTQGTLAQMLGASRETVNKQLRALAKDGKIVV